MEFQKRDNEAIRYWNIPFCGEDAEKEGQFYWELRPELKEALEKLLNKPKKLEVFNQFESPSGVDNSLNSIDSTNSKETIQIAEEIPYEEADKLYEGAKKQVTVNAYERNPRARKLCIQKYGFKCCICGFDFGEFYGEIGAGYIEVHHLKPLNEINEEYQVDPINDLRPLCPNCHSMVHKTNLSIEQLREILKKR